MDQTELPEEFTIVSPLYSTEKTRTGRWGSIMTFAASAVIAVIGRMDNSKLIHIVGLIGIIASVAVCIGTTALQTYLAKSRPQLYWP